jgi:hypothetical protein
MIWVLHSGVCSNNFNKLGYSVVLYMDTKVEPEDGGMFLQNIRIQHHMAS